MRPPAVFAFEDDGSVHVYADVAQVQTEYEGVDVEEGIYQFFDAHGKPLKPVFIVPNRSGRLFGIRWLSWVESGKFRLEPAGTDEDEAFVNKLSEVSHMAPNPWFKSLEELREQWKEVHGKRESGSET